MRMTVMVVMILISRISFFSSSNQTKEGLRRRRHWQCCWKIKDTDKTDGVHWSDHLVLQTECTSKSSVPIAAIGREKEEIWAVSVFFVYKSVPISKNRNFASFAGAILFSCQSQRQELRKIEGYFLFVFIHLFLSFLDCDLGNETISWMLLNPDKLGFFEKASF